MGDTPTTTLPALHQRLPIRLTMVVRIGEAIQVIPVAIVTHVISKRPSARSPRQPRPLRARFLPSWNSKSCDSAILASPCPPTRPVAANQVAHGRNVARFSTSIVRGWPRSGTGFKAANDPSVQRLIVSLCKGRQAITQTLRHTEGILNFAGASFRHLSEHLLDELRPRAFIFFEPCTRFFG